MRYRDASHVDVSGFYARSPRIGKIYRLLGYALVAGMLMATSRGDRQLVAILIILGVFIWLSAWFQVVGTLWRSALVASLVVGAVSLTIGRCPLLHGTAVVEAIR